MINELKKYGNVYENISLKEYNTYGIDTHTKYLIKPTSIDNLLNLLIYINTNNIKYFILGGGSNVILPDNLFDGIIINLSNLNNITKEKDLITVEAGIPLVKLANFAINNSLSGFEYVGTIPGSIGGALYGNAGVKDHEIYDNLVNIEVIRNNKLIKLNKEEITYSYRHTEFKNSNDIIVRATFKMTIKDSKEMQEIMKEAREKRRNSQPLEYKNAGCVFKNPTNDSAGRIIDSLNLKGYHIGDAYVSEKHANFIVNKGNASSEDIKKLITYIKDKVKNELNINLELEQIIVEW